MNPQPVKDPWIAVGVLAVSIALEAGSLWGALKVIRAEQGMRSFWQWFQATRQSELMVVAGEDVAALGGLAFALIALLLAISTGNSLFDALGSVVIGVLLIVVAILLVREVKSMIIGESADPLVHAEIHQFISTRPEVAAIYNLITLQWGKHIVVTVKAHMHESSDVGMLIRDINACEAAVRQKFPAVHWMFFEPDDSA